MLVADGVAGRAGEGSEAAEEPGGGSTLAPPSKRGLTRLAAPLQPKSEDLELKLLDSKTLRVGGLRIGGFELGGSRRFARLSVTLTASTRGVKPAEVTQANCSSLIA